MQKLALSFIFTALLACIALGQATTGRIVGSVTAPDGAIAGATVVVRDNQTGKERTVSARGDGTFEVPQLEFGTYTVTVSANGFKTLTLSEVKIDAGREYPLAARLEVGQVSEEVTVTAGATEINASNAELSNTISGEQVRELPLNTRNPLGLLSLTAGASATSGSINGQRTSATTVTRDGLNVQDNFIRSGAFVSDQPTVDDTSEITITTQNAGAEQGTGVNFVQLVTPRGGNKFHGNLYAFNRNSKFAANNFFNNAVNTPRAFLNRNQFGGSISGPMPLPYFGEGTPTWLKDKGFFYFNYEQFRLAQQQRINNLTTLLGPARQGLFTFNQPGVGLTTVNVLNGQGFSSGFTAGQGGVVGIDPVIQTRYLDLLPTTGNGATTGTGFTQVVSLLRNDPLRRDSWTARVDLDLSDRHAISGVYRRNNQQDARTDAAAGFSPDTFVSQGGPTNFLALAYRATFSNNFTNEIRGGFQYSEPFFNESNVPEDFIIATAGGLGLTNPLGTFRDQGRNTDYRNLQNNAVLSLGNHSLRFGGGIDFYNIQSLNSGGVTATYTSAVSGNTAIPALTATQVCGSPTCINATDLARLTNLRYFLGGFIGAATRTANIITPEEGYGFGLSDQRLNYEIISAYVSDQWRVSPRLTLNFGARYEYYTALNNPQGIFLEPVITNNDIRASVLNPNAVLNFIGGNSGKEGAFFKDDRNNIAPNVGVAYSFGDGFFGRIFGQDTVIRGGLSINYFNDEYLKATSTLSAGNPGLGAIALNAIRPGSNPPSAVLNASFSPVPGFQPRPTFETPPSFVAPPRTFLQNNQAAGGLGQVFGVDHGIQVPMVYQWNVGIQKNIGLGSVLEVRYVGNTSSDLIRTVDYNEVDVTNNGFFADFQRAQSNLAIYDNLFATCRQTQTATQCTTQLGARSAAYNAGFAGSQQLTVLNQIRTSATIDPLRTGNQLNQIQQGLAGGLAQTIIQNRLNFALDGTVIVPFQQNPNIFITEILQNAARFNYHALQAEVRRRFKNGFSFQANYTFQKTLTDLPFEDQNRQGEVQESSNPDLNYGRSDFDRTHVVNANMIYELPFGRGKKFFDRGGLTNALLGGWQFTSIINIESGAPLGIVDPRGTKSIAFKSGRQSASSNLSAEEIKQLTGIFNTPNGIYFFNPSVLNATITNATTGEIRQGFDLNQTLPAGFTLTSVRATNPVGTAPFAGQVFFFNNTGGASATGNLPRNFINGTPFFNWTAGLYKNFRFAESMRLQLRAEAFNVLNQAVFSQTADLNINSNNFGLITATRTQSNPRIIQFGARFDF